MALNPTINYGAPAMNDPSVPKDTRNLLRRGLGAARDAAVASAAGPLAAAVPYLTRNTAATIAPQAAPANTPVAQDNIGQGNLAALDNLGKPLAAGVRRYNLSPGNEAQVYVTRGKDGSVVFTDDAKYAAAKSAGGLRRGDAPADFIANTQGPRAGYEYAKSSLEQQGLHRNQYGMLDDGKLHDALVTAASGGAADTEQGLSDRIDANLLRGRLADQQRAAAAAAGGMSARDQINMYRAQTLGALGAERNAIARSNADRENRADSRKSMSELMTQYQSLKATDPDQANQLITERLNRIGADPSYANTDEGRFVKQAFLNDVLRPGANKSLHGIEWGDRGAVPALGYGDIAVDGNGNFQGFKDAEGNLQYPRQRGGLSRLFSTNRSVFGNPDNYDGSVYDVAPETWRALYSAENPPPKK